jgi:hypothetical protein
VDAATPLSRDAQGKLSAVVCFKLENTGRSPARYALVDAKLFARGPTATEWQQAQDMCAADRVRPINPGRPGVKGVTLFPGQTFEQPFGLVLEPADETRLAAQTEHTTLMVAGCVDYILADQTEHHQTAFAFELDRRGPNGGVLIIDPKDAPVPAGDLLFELNPGLAPNAD